MLLCLIGVFAVAMTRTDWGINITKLLDFFRPRLEDFLVSTGAPPEWRPEDENIKSCVEDSHGGEESLDPLLRPGMV